MFDATRFHKSFVRSQRFAGWKGWLLAITPLLLAAWVWWYTHSGGNGGGGGF